MDLNGKFPTYQQFDPKVPVWCVTPDQGACLHRFFDTSPISPSGRYLALIRMPFEDRRPSPGDTCQIIVIDLQQGTERIVADSRGWEPQMGANLNWGASDHDLFFNDVDTQTWKPFAWKLDFLTGRRQRMDGTVYHASPDGKWLISANMTTMRKTQPGYGVCIPDDGVRPNIGPSPDDGFYLTDTATGRCRLLLSLRDAFTRANPAILIDDPSRYEIYGFHSKFNPQGNRLMLSIRWFPATGRPQWDMFKTNFQAVRYAWVTMNLDGSHLHCAVGPEQWEKGGHHATWFPDGRRISMNLDINREGRFRFVQVDADGRNLRTIRDDIYGSGHPTIHPDGQHLLTDTYTREPAAFGDGTIPLRWVDLATGAEQTLVRINTEQPHPDSVLRIDPHPAWDRTWRYITFNAFTNGTRRVYIADMAKALAHS